MDRIKISEFHDLGESSLRLEIAERFAGKLGDVDFLCDRLEKASCFFFRSVCPFELLVDGAFTMKQCKAGGWLLQNLDRAASDYWFPIRPLYRRLNDQGHILEERSAELTAVEISAREARFQIGEAADAWVVDVVVWRLDEASLAKELSLLSVTETEGYFLLGSHSRYGRPADLYRHLVHGWVYEDRYAWPKHRRICSENDAHALYLVFNGLEATTGKRLYRQLKNQVLVSVLSRQGEDGGFRHGEWTERMESHYRLHCSAMHLMAECLGEVDDPMVMEALQRAVAFVARQHDETDIGVWFFHDELETSEKGMRAAPFKWWPGNALGKAPQNMLVLNTHLDTLVALERYEKISGDTQYAPLVESGYAAAGALLSRRPMEWLYRLIFSAIRLTMLPTERAARLPLWQRIWKRLGWQVFIPLLPRLKTRFPRLVMPGGYIDRELSLQTWALPYLSINLMDLVRVARDGRREALWPYVDAILEQCRDTEILYRWAEKPPHRYAIGFLAEGLILMNVEESRPDADDLLAEALVLCVREKIGLPPSVNGGNAEFTSTLLPVPRSIFPNVVVANLSTQDMAVCMVVNSGLETVELADSLVDVPPEWPIPTGHLKSGDWKRLAACH